MTVRYRTLIMDSQRWKGFEFRSSDIVISTPPKCGTTWTQMLCAMLIFDGPDFPAPLSQLSPWLDQTISSLDTVRDLYAAQPHRRFIKTHTPLDGLPMRNYILDVVAHGKTIKRRVGFDETTVQLRGIESAHRIERVNGLIQPRR